MAFYVSDIDLIEKSFNDYEEGSAKILNRKNPWYHKRVTLMDDVEQYE